MKKIISLLTFSVLTFCIISQKATADSLFSLDCSDVSKSFVDSQITQYPSLIPTLNFSLYATKNTEIAFDFEDAQGFEPDEINYLRDIIIGQGNFKVGIYSCVKLIFGSPFESFTVKLTKTTDKSKVSSFNPLTMTMTLTESVTKPEDIFPKLETVMHEIVHAFSGRFLKRFDNFEEGFAVSITNLAAKLFCDFNGILGGTSRVFNGIPIMLRDYQLYNQPAVSPPFGSFWRQPRVIDVGLRYHLAGTVWHKIWIETSQAVIGYKNPDTYDENKFFFVFNKLLFESIIGNPEIVVNSNQNFLALKKIVQDSLILIKGNDEVEGEKFEKWWNNQFILSYTPQAGNFLYGTAPLNGNFPNIVYKPSTDKNQKCFVRWLDFFVRSDIGDELRLDGSLYASIISQNWNGLFFGQDVTENVICEFASDDGTSFNCAPNEQLLSFIESKSYNGFELNFKNLPMGAYKIVLTVKYRNYMEKPLILYFANKITTVAEGNKCIVIFSQDFKESDYFQVSNATNKKSINVNKLGFALLPFANGEKLTFEAGNYLSNTVSICKTMNMPTGHCQINFSLDMQNPEQYTNMLLLTDSFGKEINSSGMPLDNKVQLKGILPFNKAYMEVVVYKTNIVNQATLLQKYLSNINDKGKLVNIHFDNLTPGKYHLMVRFFSLENQTTTWLKKSSNGSDLRFSVPDPDMFDDL